MTEQVIAPVIPSSARLRRESGPGRGQGGPLPLAELFTGLPVALGVVYGMGRVDGSGRVVDRSITAVLDWRPGERLTLAMAAGAVVAGRDPDGWVRLPARSCVVLPAPARLRFGIQSGDRVLLAAMPEEDLLAVYPLPTVHDALHRLRNGGDQR